MLWTLSTPHWVQSTNLKKRIESFDIDNLCHSSRRSRISKRELKVGGLRELSRDNSREGISKRELKAPELNPKPTPAFMFLVNLKKRIERSEAGWLVQPGAREIPRNLKKRIERPDTHSLPSSLASPPNLKKRIERHKDKLHRGRRADYDGISKRELKELYMWYFPLSSFMSVRISKRELKDGFLRPILPSHVRYLNLKKRIERACRFHQGKMPILAPNLKKRIERPAPRSTPGIGTSPANLKKRIESYE